MTSWAGLSQDEEALVTDNKVINEPSYFNILECGKNFLNNLDATCEWACMENLKNYFIHYNKSEFNSLEIHDVALKVEIICPHDETTC